MDQQNPTLAKILILDTGKFEQWQFRIQQYLQHEHYALWEVIEFVDSYEAPTVNPTTGSTSDGTGKKKGRTVTLTANDMQKRKNNVKARTTLLLSLLDEHQLRFSKYKTAQELWAAILKTFGGNEATKKMKKNLLKQHYGNFKAEGSETLEQTFNRLHVIRNRNDLDTMSLDDLYNHLKVYESEVQKKSEPNSQNMAFISSAKHSSGNEEINIASVSSASTNVSTASGNIIVTSISQDTACAYIASQFSGSQIKFEDINQIDEDDIEEIDIKWNMALLSMRADWFWKKTGKKISIQGTDVAGFDKPKTLKDLMAIDEVGWDWSYMANDEENHALVADEEAPTEFALMAKTNAESKVFNSSSCSKAFEARLAEHRSQELKYCKKIRVLEFKTESRENCIESLTKDLELLKKEKGELETKLTGFQTASKDLDSILESQRLDKNKEGLGYSAVPPPPAQIYSPPKKDMSWTGLLEFKDDTVTDHSRPSPAIESTSDDAQNRNPSVTETEASPSTISPKSFIKFVKANYSPTKSKTNKVKKSKKPPVKYAEQFRKPTKNPNVSGNQRNWNNLKSHHLGPNFVMKKKACFNCGDLNHLAYDCSKRVKKGTYRSQNNTHKSFTPNPIVHRPYKPPMRTMRPNMNAPQPNRISFNKPLAHSYTKRPFQRTSPVKSQYRGPRVPPVRRKFSTVNRKFPTANTKFPLVAQNFPLLIWDSGCSRHMTGNISYLSDYEPFDGGYVSFGQGGCKITGKGTIKTDKLKFENVYFVKDLKTKRVEENLHVEFLENKAIEKGAGPNWLFDIDSLTKSMNYVPVDAGINFTNLSGTKDAASQEVKKDVSSLRYIALPNWVYDALLESSSSKPQDDCSIDVPESSGNFNPTATSTNPPADQLETLTVETPIPTVSSQVPTACFTDSQEPSNILRVTTNSVDSDGVEADVSNIETTITASPTPTLRIHKDHPKRVRPIGTKWVLKNEKDERGIVIKNKARLVAQGHTQEEGIDYNEVFAPVARIEAIRLFLAYASFIGFTVYQMDVKSAFLYGTIDEEVYVMQPPGFQDPKFPVKVYKVEKAMYRLHQAPRA
nr:copia protein [Tanacetum cinerariifolium]